MDIFKKTRLINSQTGCGMCILLLIFEIHDFSRVVFDSYFLYFFVIFDNLLLFFIIKNPVRSRLYAFSLILQGFHFGGNNRARIYDFF